MVQATDFAVGITTLTDVTSISLLSHDVRDMADAINSNNYVDARRIYKYGKNSVQYDVYGQVLDDLLSLQRLARAGRPTYGEDPSYLFHVLGLGDAGEDIDVALGTRGAYADEYIVNVLNDPDTAGTLGAQASTVLVVGMYATHLLWKGLLDCVSRRGGYATAGNGTGYDSHLDPRKAFDEFIALYIGADQTLAPDWDGDMLYELAQAGGDRFGTVDAYEGEAYANVDVKLRYQEVQRLLSGDEYCTRDDQVMSLWKLVNQILSSMYVPLYQMLIHSMKQDGDTTKDQADKVRMYSLALIPQLSQCRPSIHSKLKEYLLDKTYDRDDFPRILQLLQLSYDCLGITCADIGAYRDDNDEVTIAECANYEANHPLASFVPKEDVRTVCGFARLTKKKQNTNPSNIFFLSPSIMPFIYLPSPPIPKLSKVDLDIHAITILLKFPSNTNHMMAQLYYQYGKATALDETGAVFSDTSLRDMVSSVDNRKWSPYYDDYVSYFNQEPKVYVNASMRSDETIMAMFNGTGIATGMSMEQRSAYLVSLIQRNVVPEFMMGLLGLSLRVCRDPENDLRPTLYYDAFAALYIGSMVGILQNDQIDDGLMMWSLAANRARNFNTQTDEYTAIINEEMVDLLFAGQSELDRGDCDNFDKTFSRVLHLFLLPLVQSTIWFAIRNQDTSITDVNVVIGQAMALSVLPIVQKYHPDDASVIERNMIIVDGTTPVVEGPQAVANAFYETFDELGWDCEYIGQAEGVDACEQDRERSNSSSIMPSDSTIFFLGLVQAAIVLFGM
jgi:hypothetical protein